MHADLYTMFYGHYKFTAELDTGSEMGGDQLTVWFAEKVDIEHVPLSQFSIDLLFKALQEPLQSRLRAQLEQEKISCQQTFEDQITALQLPFQATKGLPAKKLPNKVKRQISQLRQQMNNAGQRLEREFIKRELISPDKHCFDLHILQAASQVFGEPRFLRDFYFEEASKRHIQDFCHKFALDEAYRQDVLAGRTRWAVRDALFIRNLLSIAGEESLFAKDSRYDDKARKFFHWLDVHCEEILALPEYQRLQEIDKIHVPNIHDPDPEIKLAVDYFNLIPGVTIQFSCQGVSGKVHFQDYDLLTVSSHREYGFVSFSAFGPYAHDTIITLLPAYPNITTDPMPYNYALQLVLRSTGDNLSFRQELLALARRVVTNMEATIHSIQTKMIDNKISTSTHCIVADMEESYDNPPQFHHISRWQDTIYPESCPRTSAAGGIIPSRLAWLCQPEQIEHTLYLLCHLNHWAKARDYLLYDDRRGLYEVKAAVLQQAYKVGTIRPTAYIDGSEAFARNYPFDMAVDIATEVFTERLEWSFESKNNSLDKLDSDARKLFARIMGYEAKMLADSQALDEERTKTFIAESLQALVDQARSTRQPIASQDLAALFISPADLLEVHLTRDRLFPDWDELDESETRQLDPEGVSLIAFQYDSSTAHYVFHLPLRIAEKFLPQQLIRELQTHASTSREVGTFYGRAITEAESQQYPIANLLRELLVDISAICPHGLAKKEHHFRSSRAWSEPNWHNDEEDDDLWDEDYEEWT
jgi:hypothetical protein